MIRGENDVWNALAAGGMITGLRHRIIEPRLPGASLRRLRRPIMPLKVDLDRPGTRQCTCTSY